MFTVHQRLSKNRIYCRPVCNSHLKGGCFMSSHSRLYWCTHKTSFYLVFHLQNFFLHCVLLQYVIFQNVFNTKRPFYKPTSLQNVCLHFFLNVNQIQCYTYTPPLAFYQLIPTQIHRIMILWGVLSPTTNLMVALYLLLHSLLLIYSMYS
jgi:hypothetical protein